MTDTFNERLRLIRIRRKRESTRFRDELRIIPRWLVWTCLALYIIALIIGMLVNLHGFQNNGQFSRATKVCATSRRCRT